MTDFNIEQHVLIDYTNHAGLRQLRQIVPQRGGIAFGATPWHSEPQWTVTAYDIGKDALRTFAMKDIHSWRPPNHVSPVDISLAKQLQRSMERNARTSNRLWKLHKLMVDTHESGHLVDLKIDVAGMVEAMLKDEEPTWPSE